MSDRYRKRHNCDAILADYLAGMTGGELARKYKCPRSYGAILAHQRGVKRDPEINRVARSKSGSPRRMPVKPVLDLIESEGYAAAAKKFKYSPNHLRKLAKTHGIKVPTKTIDQAGIIKAYTDGVSIAEIAKRFNCNPSYPSKLMRRRGLEPRQ